MYIVLSGLAHGQTEAGSFENKDTEIVTYEPRFFNQYQPLTALDMVRQVPGFQLDDGEDLRGFGSAAGNILINGNTPSAKQDIASEILARIPAGNVARIELIRGQVEDINMQGHSVVANVILRSENQSSTRWETFATYTSPSPLGVGGNISMARQWGNINYNFGIDIERDTNGINGTVERYDANDNLIQLRSDDRQQTGIGINGIFLNASTLINETQYNLNTNFGFRQGDGREVSRRFPFTGNNRPFEIIFENSDKSPEFEIGLDAERALNDSLQGKAIFVFNHSELDETETQETLGNNGLRTNFKQVDLSTNTTEVISRLEFDWSGWSNHDVSIDLEGAYNRLKNGLVLTEDDGSGAAEVFVPNGNSTVEEVRGDFIIKDTWNLGKLVWDYGIGAEISTISQTGDTDQERSFFFIKPTSLLTWSPNQAQQTRLRLEREVSQLDFSDFVSATVFVDDDLALGNPDLKPQTTWIAELSYEHRFGELGVITVTAFHHWLEDVLDLLPISDEFEAPGNIGNGRTWGIIFATTIPLNKINLSGARLDIQTRLQDSTVTDPVMGDARQISAFSAFPGPPTIRFYSDNDYVVDIAFRQDLEEARWAWGFDTAFQADRAVYKVNELENFEEGVELNAFVETTRWFGIKIRLQGRNLTNYLEVRDRLSYTGRREISPIQRREFRLRKPDRIFTLTFSGSF
jgi:hypothetical protein